MARQKLTPEECAALQARIDALTTDYEDVLAGRKARVLVDQNGERIEYNGANALRLSNYIEVLKKQYRTDCLGCRLPITRPIVPFF